MSRVGQDSVRRYAARIILVGGGVRCGKSAFAVALAQRLGERRVFIATAEALDEEMADRIADHRRARGSDFATIEEPLAVPARLAALAEQRACDVVVVDCLTLWLANLLLSSGGSSSCQGRSVENPAGVPGTAVRVEIANSPAAAVVHGDVPSPKTVDRRLITGSSGLMAEIEKLATTLDETRAFHVVLVTNEVGMGIVPETPLGRAYRDLCGRAHQRLATIADEVYFGVLGSMLRIKPGPVTTVETLGEENHDELDDRLRS
ncbi:MAG: bifunctional adenosylcobinamide kinase/adenosylcobinamide-phosphate guanylyltransferase [Pseudomonadota bacterium]